MRFKKGDSVEVMNIKEEPVLWHVAKILSGDGYTYRVVQGAECCIVGDIVEVFNEYCWMVAVILKVLGKRVNKRNKIYLSDSDVQNQYLVRLIGSSKELIVNGSSIRVRQSWHDGKWIPMEKTSVGDEDYQKNFQIPQEFNARVNSQNRKNYTNTPSEASFSDSPLTYSRSQKRMSPYESFIIEAHNGQAQKFRAIEKDGRKQRVVKGPVLEKVDDACSVGSCSVTSQSLNKYGNYFNTLIFREAEAMSSDAESCCGSEYERKTNFLPQKEELEVSIHRLELHAYRSTLEALYASGPLSWEQETMLTNLRIMLHISNDVHLTELKHLISAKTAINIR